MLREILLLDSRWRMHLNQQLDDVLVLQRFFRRTLLLRRHSRRLATVRGRRRAIQNHKKRFEERYLYAFTHAAAARVIQAMLRGHAARKAAFPKVMFAERTEAMAKRKADAQRLTQEEAAAHQQLIEHRQQLEEKRAADTGKQELEINKLALAWAQAEAQFITDQAAQEAVKARMASLEAAIKQEEEKSEAPEEDNLVGKLQEQKVTELKAKQVAKQAANDAVEKESEVAQYGSLAK